MRCLGHGIPRREPLTVPLSIAPCLLWIDAAGMQGLAKKSAA